MKADIDRLKEKKNNSDDSKKLKKMKEELKSANKKTEEAITTNDNLNKKLGQEVSARAHAEKEIVSQSALQLIIEKGTQNQDTDLRQPEAGKAKAKSGQECKDFNKPKGCSYGSRCKHEHIKRDGLGTKKDCTHWMASECSFTDKACNYAHDPAKKGIKTKQAFFAQGIQQHLPAQGLEGQSMSMQDQVNFHVNMMMQQKNSNPTFPTFPLAGNVSSQGLGGASSSAQRMDSQSQVFGMQPAWTPQQLTVAQMVQQALLQQHML